MVAVDSSARSMTSLVLWLGFQNQVWFPSYWQVVSPIRQLLVTAKECLSPLHPWGYPALLGGYDSWVSCLGRLTVGCFSSLEACLASSGTMDSSSQGGGFQISTSSGPLGPVSEVHWSLNCKAIYCMYLTNKCLKCPLFICSLCRSL